MQAYWGSVLLVSCGLWGQLASVAKVNAVRRRVRARMRMMRGRDEVDISMTKSFVKFRILSFFWEDNLGYDGFEG